MAAKGACAPASWVEVPRDLRKTRDKNRKGIRILRSIEQSKPLHDPVANRQRQKKAETRARKIAEFVAMLECGETIHGWGKTGSAWIYDE